MHGIRNQLLLNQSCLQLQLQSMLDAQGHVFATLAERIRTFCKQTSDVQCN